MLLWCALSVYTLSAHHSNITTVAYTAAHTQFVILINFINFLTNFNLTTCTFEYIHK